MKRGVTEVIRRGFESMLANWPVILLRLGEVLLLAAVIIALVLAILVPVLVSAGLSKIAFNDIDSAQEAILTFLAQNALLFIWIFVAISIALLVFVAVHSFVEAGAAQIFLDADRKAGAGVDGPRTRFAAFSMERWLLGGRRGWWTAFWIYNIVWTVAGIILLIPLVLVLGIMLILGDATASLILGCFVLVAVVFLAIVIAIITNLVAVKAILDSLAYSLNARESRIAFIAIITNLVAVKAILDSLAYSLNARDALRMAWREVKTDAGRHLAVVGLLMLVTFAVSGVLGSASMGFSWSRSLSWSLFFAPMRIAIQLANSAVSAAIANWMLGSFAALVTERRP